MICRLNHYHRASLLLQACNYACIFIIALASSTLICLSCQNIRDVNKNLTPKDQDKDKDLTHKDKDKDLTPKDQDKDKDLLDLTPKDKDKDKDLTPKYQDKDLKYVLK